MEVFHSLEAYKAGPNPVATIGTFDGVHIGHKEILSRVKVSANALHGETVLISFHPHPRLVLFPEKNSLQLLHTLEEKIEMLDAFGIDKLLLIPFTKDFSRTPSSAFIEDILVNTVKIKKIVIGYDHRFGKNRGGGIDELRDYSRQFGYEVEEIPAQAIDDANVSSTKIRNALLSHDLEAAHKYLGYRYSFRGMVVHGEKKGRILGYPTANLQVDDSLKLIPENGVYFARAYLKEASGEETPFFGMMNIGTKPSVGNFGRGVEIFLFNFLGDLYGRTLRIEPLSYLREEKKFDSQDELIEAMHQDRIRSLKLIEKFP